MDAFDADVLIYAAQRGNPMGAAVHALFAAADADPHAESAGIGSVLLLPEVLAKPFREDDRAQLDALTDLLSRLDLQSADQQIAQLSMNLAAQYRLHAADAIHLATAIAGGADRFITNNSRDFTDEITEIEVVGPLDLPGVTR